MEKIRYVGINEKKFWKLNVNLSSEKYDKKRANKYSKKYLELLTDACNLRLRADVKVGSALSGGLDSSSIVYTINQLLKRQSVNQVQETFSCVYNNRHTKEFDESGYINELVKYLDVSSKRIEPNVTTIKKDYEKLIYVMDNPPNDSTMSGWHVYKLVKETDVKVTLDGQGADEQQAGYLSYFLNYSVNLPFTQFIEELKSFKKLPQINGKSLIYSVLLWLFIRIFSKRLVSFLLKEIGKSPNSILPLNEVLKYDLDNNLVKLLHYGDRLSMAHSIESRAPFMDYCLVEFTALIPAVYKLHGGWTKYFPRLAMQDKLPDNITWRKDKMGFPNAEEYWFKGDIKEWCISNIEKSNLLKKLNIGQNIRKEMSTIPSTHLVRLLNLSIWDDVFWNNRNV